MNLINKALAAAENDELASDWRKEPAQYASVIRGLITRIGELESALSQILIHNDASALATGEKVLAGVARQCMHQIQEPESNTAKPELDAETQHHAAIGAAVMRACKELPEGAEIQIYLERGAGTVHMTDGDGNEFYHLDEDHEDFACRIDAAIDGAIAINAALAAQAKQGEQA